MIDQIIENLTYVTIDEPSSYSSCNIETFDCGDQGLNNFLKMKARANHDDMLGATTLCILEGTNEIVGYYTLKCSSLLFYADSSNIRSVRGIPSMEVVMFAIDKKFQKNGIGTYIFQSLIYEIQEQSLSFSSVKAIALYALNNEECLNFYEEKLKFKKLEEFMGLIYDRCENETIPMYMRLK